MTRSCTNSHRSAKAIRFHSIIPVVSRPAPRAARSQAAGVQAAIIDFLAAARQPVLQESGELPFALQSGRYEVETRAGAVLVSVWDETRQLHRRAVSVVEAKPGRLTLRVERFGAGTGRVVLYDESAPSSAVVRKQGKRHVFRELLRGMVRREFPGWRLLDLSAELDLEHSLSANYPRALLRLGRRGAAVIGAAPGPAEPAMALTYGLIWVDYVRRRNRDLTVDTLVLFLPPAALTGTALRIRWLEGVQFRLFTYSNDGTAREVDLADCGNLHTVLQPPHAYTPSALHPEAVVTPSGLRFRGLEVPPCPQDKLAEAISSMARIRSAEGVDRLHPHYTRRPEGWLEFQIRSHLDRVDATLRPVPVYGQVISVAGVDRGIADLLAIDWQGRLAVMEIKAEEDIHLPLQALDYWLRVAHHAERGDLSRLQYFPEITVLPASPRLLLAAPALCFHPATETILRFFSSSITVERLGLALEWRQRVRVLFRHRGPEGSSSCSPENHA